MPAASPFTPVVHAANLRTLVEDSVAGAIVSGQLPPGELVSVPALAAEFDVSATPVREAMINLQHRGLVEPVRNKGFRVTAVSEQDLTEIVQLRRLVEPPVVRDLAGAVGPEDVERLRGLARAIVEAADAGNLPAYLAADVDFHRELVTLGGNRRIAALVTELRRETRLTGLSGMLNTDQLAESAAEHERLLDLIAAADGDGAEALMSRHIGHVLGWWSGRPEPAGG
ncbi:GntR family transcriptional regulator [Georgenia sp. TF02-10]|uniref:GntR family transcriptional regulator n=1 Tax=Georgenia sp. TF02-10 TaxID=2917725 RepID=UPI001FA7A518|nr:GntR family transcriptional regulator [Georgenia sp. TF02-10]UNX55103.1 GntR family transcriptional regulator [Georgenia sp. TF02-10]